MCGGTLISNRYVLTAASCLKYRGELVSVRLGATKSQSCIEPIRAYVNKTIPHPTYYLYEHQSFDIALLRLSDEIAFNDYVSPICLPTDNAIFHSTKFVIPNWGDKRTLRVQTTTSRRRKSIEKVASDDCMTKYKQENKTDVYYGIQNQYLLCAGTAYDRCHNEIGSPLMQIKDYVWTLVGISSYRPYLCHPSNRTGIYTSVYGHMDWISQEIELRQLQDIESDSHCIEIK